MKKTNLFFTFLLFVILVALLAAGCGEDDAPNNNNTGGTPPTINMAVGSVFTMDVDSLIGTSSNETVLFTTQTYLSQGTFFGQTNVFEIRSVTRDSFNVGPQFVDTFYVRYDGGKFYQYGVLQLLDPNITPTWDVVADFTLAQGTEWTIASSVPLSFIPGGTVNVTAKIAADTTFTTDGWGDKSVHCFRSQISGTVFVGPANLGTIYFDYFIGDAAPAGNPSGIVRLRLNPVNLIGFSSAGIDQHLLKWTP